MIQRKKANLLLALLMVSCCGSSQQFRNAADLGPVGTDSFYRIPITPALSSYLKTDLRDIRIADEKRQWVPHIVNWSLQNNLTKTVTLTLPLVKNENTGSSSILVIKNSSKNNINNLILVLKNTAASRTTVVSGSDDQQSWFTITDSIRLSSPEAIHENKSALRINFPTVNYHYFKLTIYNGNNDPFNIQEVQNDGPADPALKENYIINPAVNFTQKDTVAYSLVRIESPAPYHFDRFQITVSSPKYYARRAKLYLSPDHGSVRSCLLSIPDHEYIFSSGNNTGYEVPRTKNKLFYLLIENRDNPPLQINAVSTEQAPGELIAFLEKRKKYRLLFTDSNAVVPDYDLLQFQNRIPANLPVLNAGKITMIEETAQRAEGGDDKKRWLWPAIITIVLLLAYFTWSLNRDLKKKNDTEHHDRL